MSSLPSLILTGTLSKHTKPINTLCIASDGQLLLSGADDAQVVVWDLNTGDEMQTISCLFNGPISAASWIDFPGGRAFCFGCADGSIHVYHQRNSEATYDFASLATAHHGAIEDLVYDPNHRRIASAGNGCISLWSLDENCVLSKHASSPQKPFIARSASFFDNGDSVLVCYLESHEVIGYTVEPWNLLWSHQLPTRIGHAVLSSDQRLLIVSNLCDGIDTYTVPPTQLLRSFKHPIRTNVPLQVHSALQGAMTVAGSDDGCVRLFEQRTGQLWEMISHGDVGSLVQAVTSHSDSGNCTIVSGSSGEEGTNVIKVWTHRIVDRKPQAASMTQAPSRLGMWQIFFLVVAVSAVVQIGIAKMSWDKFTQFIVYAREYMKIVED